MYLPSDFVVNDAVECGKLIDQAYAQYVNAVAPVSSAVPWTIQDGYNNLGIFSAVESGKMLPFGFVVSKNRRLFVVVRGTQTPKLFLKASPFRFQHVNEPVALTYQLNTVADNHNLTQLYQRLLPPPPSGMANRS